MDVNKKNEIIGKINDIFVNDFDLINISKDKINDYLLLLNINDLYNYNEFCVDLINTSSKILDNITDENFLKLDLESFITDILEKMVKTKIMNSNITQEQKTVGLMKLELDKHMSKTKK